MPRKVTISVGLTQEAVDWMDQQDESNSKIVRDAVKQYREAP